MFDPISDRFEYFFLRDTIEQYPEIVDINQSFNVSKGILKEVGGSRDLGEIIPHERLDGYDKTSAAVGNRQVPDLHDIFKLLQVGLEELGALLHDESDLEIRRSLQQRLGILLAEGDLDTRVDVAEDGLNGSRI